jgi:hypothetical protein
MKLFQEPLVGFLLIGGFIFLLYSLANQPNEPSIEISQSVIDNLIIERELILERALNDGERHTIKQQFIDQEVLVREGIARNLHTQDGKIRHRLADKMMFLIADDPDAPTTQQLDDFYHQHISEYSSPPLINFDHVFFTDYSRAEAALPQLIAGDIEFKNSGDSFWIGNRLERMSAQDVVTIMGKSFAVNIETLPTQQWQGPLQSIRGWHLVKLQQHIPSEAIPRDALTQRLYQEWTANQRDQMRRSALDTLNKQYMIKLVP